MKASELLRILQEEKEAINEVGEEDDLIADPTKPLTSPSRFNKLAERLNPEGQKNLQRMNTVLGKVLNVVQEPELIFPKKMQALRHLKLAAEIFQGAGQATQLGRIREVETEVTENLFLTIERLVDQLRELSTQSLSDSEKNTLKLYMMKTIMPAVRKILRGGVYELEGEKNMDNVITQEDVEKYIQEAVALREISEETWEAYQTLLEALGPEMLLQELMQAMSGDEARENLEHIARKHDIEAAGFGDIEDHGDLYQEQPQFALEEALNVADKIYERELTDTEKKKKEDYVKGMKKSEKDFKDRYGDRWQEIMYATSTKLAKGN